MERVHDLIQKLASAERSGAGALELLQITGELQALLLQETGANSNTGSSKVAVIMPQGMVAQTPAPPIEHVKVQEPLPTARPEPVQEHQQQTVEEPKKEEAFNGQQPYTIRKPETLHQDEPLIPEPTPYAHPEQPAELHKKSAPLAKQQLELHEMLGEKSESLNDTLKAPSREVAHTLTGAPIKDLRKGIGVNDKFVFISELFGGDEGLYDRSIKTINAFHILPEAQYWINKELKAKLHWDDDSRTVQHFYELVKRRFS